MSTDELKFKDAGQKLQGLSEPTAAAKVYPRFSVDLDQFPGLEAEVDETVELHLRGRVCSVEHSDYCHRMDVEVTSVAVPTHTHNSIGPMNEADQILGKLKSGSRY